MSAYATLLQPAISGDDPIIRKYRDHREQVTPLLMGKLHNRVSASALKKMDALLEVFATLPPLAKQEILMHPHYQHWWFYFLTYYKGRQDQKLEAWLAEFAQFLIIPALQYDCWPEQGLSIPLTEDRRIRFPGYGYTTLPGGKMTERMVHVQKQRSELVFSVAEERYAIAIDTLLARGTSTQIERLQKVPDTEIAVDGSDTWTLEFVHFLREREATQVNGRSDIEPGVVGAENIHSLHRTFLFLQQCWPEMYAEMTRYVHLLVPFTSQTRDAFTNISWGGAIFLRAQFDPQWYTLERLVHETSHLFLNLLMSLEPIHQHDWNDMVPSPFRPGLRPITGLYHGAFVFTRVAMVMDRAYRLTGDQEYSQRIPVIIDQVKQARETLRQYVRLTPLGKNVLDEISQEIDGIEQRYQPHSEDLTPMINAYLREW